MTYFLHIVFALKTSISLKLQDRYAVKDVNGSGVLVQFHSKENASGNKPQLLVTEKNIESFKLTELKVNGTLIDGFVPTQTTYFVILPYNSTAVPTVTAVASSPLSTLKIINASNLSGTATERTTLITNKIASDSVVFKVVFELSANPDNATLDSLKIDNVNLEGFSKDTYQYNNLLPYTTTTKPIITVIPADPFASVNITIPTNLNGTQQERTATVSVTSQNGLNNKTYSVEYEILPKLDIFLAIGQSNMAGRGLMTVDDLVPIDSVYILTPGANLEIASNPLNKYSSVRKDLSMQQMSPSCSFVKMMRDKTQHEIGLMQNARGGSAIESWIKGSTDQFYEEALRRALEIKKFGEIKGIIWHQGESNIGDPVGYKTKLSTMISDFRSDLGIPNLFIVAGELAYWNSSVSSFNSMIQTISTFLPNSDWASANELTPLIDTSDPHFDAASVKIMGERYADKMYTNVYSTSALLNTKDSKIKLAEIKTKKNEIRIDNVTENISLLVFNLTGKQIVNQQLNQNDNCTLNLSSGVYFVRLTNQKSSQVEKVIL